MNMRNAWKQKLDWLETKYIWKCGHYITNTHTGGMRNSYDDICTVEDFFDRWNPSTATLMEEMCGTQEELCWKINLIRAHAMRLFWLIN